MKRGVFLLPVFITFFIYSLSFAQVGIGTTSPDPASTLHVDGATLLEGDFLNQEMLGVHASSVQNVPFANSSFNALTGTDVNITISDGNGVDNSAVLITGFARVFGGSLIGNDSSVGGYFMVLQRDTSPLFPTPVTLTYTSGICYLETSDGTSSFPLAFGGGGHISYVDSSLAVGTYYYRLVLVPNSNGITGGTFDVYQRDLNVIQIKR